MADHEHPHAAASAAPLTGYERELLRRVREGENVCAGLTGPVVDGIYATLDQLWKRGLITLTTPDDDRASGGRAFDYGRITWSLTDEGRARGAELRPRLRPRLPVLEVLRAGAGEHARVDPVTKLIVHTARISSADPDRLDVTRQSGSELGKAFAPSWMLLRPFLAKRKADLLTERDWLDYVARYTDEMRTSFRRHGDAWESLLARERVVLVCYCVLDADRRCHRVILGRDILPKLGAIYRGELSVSVAP